MINSLAANSINMNAWPMYLMYGLIVAFITFESIFYLVRSVLRAKKLNMDMGKIKKVITTSISFSILPAIGIGIGVVTLVGALGIAFPAIRLSVIGSLQYEVQMADGAATAIGGSLTGLIGNMDADSFLTIAVIMTVGIVWGPLLISLFFKKLQPKFSKIASMNLKTEGEMLLDDGKKNNIGDLIFSVVFIGLILGYLAMAISTIFGKTTLSDGTKISNMNTIYGYYNLIAIVVAAILMAFFEFLMKNPKMKWLSDLSIPISMLIAMAVVAIISYFAQQNGWDPTLAKAVEDAVHSVI